MMMVINTMMMRRSNMMIMLPIPIAIFLIAT